MTLLYLSVVMGRAVFYQAPLAHPRIRRGTRYAHEIELSPRIPTRMSSVGSPVTDSRLSCHNFCCDRNNTVRLIQIARPTLPEADRTRTDIFLR